MAYSIADPFPFTPIETVLEWVATAEKEIAKGATILATASGDVSVQKSIQKNATERHALCLQSLYAKDPDTYEAFANVGATVTGVAFNSSASLISDEESD